MTSRAALVEMQLDPYQKLDEYLVTTGVFIALDLETDRHLVGHFVGWDKGRLVLSLPDDAAVLLIPKSSIIKGYWAPMGYRPT